MPPIPSLRDLAARAGARLRAFSAPATKSHRAATFISIDGPRSPIHAPRDYAAFAREGFMQNPIAYRSVRMIAEAVGCIPYLLYENNREVEDHPLLDLIRRPSANTTTADFLEHLVGFLLVSGNAYLEAVSTNGQDLRALYTLRPDRMTVVPGPDGWPDAHAYTLDGRTSRIEGEAIPGVPRILHLKQFHPLDDHYGLSPIEAASSAIDLHNTASAWNKALLDNSARPSGALVYTARDGNLTTDQFDRLKRELESGFQGAGNAGRPLLLEGGLDWKAMSLSPRDMDFIEARHAAAREIALALGVPPMLLAIPGDNTYSNYQEATRAFWRQTVLPLANRIAAGLTTWLAAPHGLTIKIDLDQVEALSGERAELWARLNESTFLTQNEKREAAGFDPLLDGNAIRNKYDPGQLRNPAGSGRPSGRWTKRPAGTPASSPTQSETGEPSGDESDPPSDPDPSLDDTADPNEDIDNDVDAEEEEAEQDEDEEGDPNLIPAASGRRRGQDRGNPQQEARLAAATQRALLARSKVRELEPEWKEPVQVSFNIQGRIQAMEANAAAAEARLAYILRDAIPNANPVWGVNRLRSELFERGFRLERPTDAPGWQYRNSSTGEEVRIMQRPTSSWSNDPPAKHTFGHYYRYRGNRNDPEGAHTPIPD